MASISHVVYRYSKLIVKLVAKSGENGEFVVQKRDGEGKLIPFYEMSFSKYIAFEYLHFVSEDGAAKKKKDAEEVWFSNPHLSSLFEGIEQVVEDLTTKDVFYEIGTEEDNKRRIDEGKQPVEYEIGVNQEFLGHGKKRYRVKTTGSSEKIMVFYYDVRHDEKKNMKTPGVFINVNGKHAFVPADEFLSLYHLLKNLDFIGSTMSMVTAHLATNAGFSKKRSTSTRKVDEEQL